MDLCQTSNVLSSYINHGKMASPSLSRFYLSFEPKPQQWCKHQRYWPPGTPPQDFDWFDWTVLVSVSNPMHWALQRRWWQRKWDGYKDNGCCQVLSSIQPKGKEWLNKYYFTSAFNKAKNNVHVFFLCIILWIQYTVYILILWNVHITFKC